MPAINAGVPAEVFPRNMLVHPSPCIPLVSVVMPIYNNAPTLDLAVRSILNQTFGDFELLLLDDGSTDETLDLARSHSDPRIRVFTDGQHLGLVARLNQAIDLSRGKYLARMDGDDISYPERFALQVKFLEEHPEVDLVGGGVVVFGRGGRLLGKRKTPTLHKFICQRPWRGFLLAHATWVGRNDWFRKYLYSPDAMRCEDQDLLFRSHKDSRFAAVKEIVLGIREESLSLPKILTARRRFAAAVFRRSVLKEQYLIAGSVIVEQVLKGIADLIAISTGLNYRLLRHRALPVTEEVAKRWREVYEGIQQFQARYGQLRQAIVEIDQSGLEPT